jgi:uncharacterized sodium:solute symporter family permease YidK
MVTRKPICIHVASFEGESLVLSSSMVHTDINTEHVVSLLAQAFDGTPYSDTE